MRKRRFTIEPDLAREAKHIVVSAFRNGPIESIHAGVGCSRCAGKEKYSHITDDEMKLLMKTAVNKVFTLLWMKKHKPSIYKKLIEFTNMSFASSWDDPDFDFS